MLKLYPIENCNVRSFGVIYHQLTFLGDESLKIFSSTAQRLMSELKSNKHRIYTVLQQFTSLNEIHLKPLSLANSEIVSISIQCTKLVYFQMFSVKIFQLL